MQNRNGVTCFDGSQEIASDCKRIQTMHFIPIDLAFSEMLPQGGVMQELHRFQTTNLRK